MEILKISLIVLNIFVMFQLQPTLSQRSGGFGCSGMLSSYLNVPIPNTKLFTGVFYKIETKGIRRDEGYVSWASRTDKFGKMLAFSDYNNLGMYGMSGGWFYDAHWAFLKTKTLGWYHIVNCGFPHKFLTTSRDETVIKNKNDKAGIALVIDEIYPGKNSPDNFLFKPMYHEDLQSYQIHAKAFNAGLVLESETSYSGKSYFLKVENSSSSFPYEESCQKSLFYISHPLKIPLDNWNETTVSGSTGCTIHLS